MKKYIFGRNFAAATLALAILTTPLAAIAQTRIKAPGNKYKVQEDVKIGREASLEVEKTFPLVNDAQAARYVESVGQKLVDSIPAQFQHSEFNYTFKIVNARDINAFALPGGPMYVNRGMIEAARNEGEMAGVMAHEISHVALRHGTAQATKQSNPLAQLGAIGLILGGAIIGGQTGAQLGQMVVAGYFLRYSREYETQADTLGAQILANAGYDPMDLANMFKTIEAENKGNNPPEWLSSHPNPANRYENINRESQLLRVSSNPIKNTAQFESVQSKLKRMPKAQTMKEIEQKAKTSQSPTMNGKYEANVALPSTQTRSYSSGNWVRLNVPNNWQQFPSDTEVWFAPQGAYGKDGITHGTLIGIYRGQSQNLSEATEDYIAGVLEANTYLRKRTNYTQTTLSGRQAYATVLAGRSPITNKTEISTVYTVMLGNGDLFYVITVVPENEEGSYYSAFRTMIRSIRLND
jgi:hypothetical protein